MKKRSIAAILLALVMSVLATFALVGCGNKDSGTYHAADNSFQGCVSEQSYSSKDSAARAFLTKEIDGAATSTTFVACEEGEPLTDKEIAKLNLGDDISVEDIDSAVYYTVEYIEEDDDYSTYTSADPNVKTYKIVLIKIGSRYYYYIPIMPKGGVITNSYIKMVCDPTKYLNVTETTVSETVVSARGYSQKSTVTATTKIDNDKAHLKMVTEVFGEKETTEYYLVKVGNYMNTFRYDEYDEEWYNAGSSPYSDAEELLEEAFNFDHSYFERTSSGFKMIDGKLEEYVQDVMSDTLSSIDALGLTISDGSAEYYVKDGKLSEVVAKLKMSSSVSGQRMSATASARTTYTDFGTTRIDLPFDVDSL